MTTKILTPQECRSCREEIKEWVDKSMVYSAGESTTEDILNKLEAGTALCWMKVDEDNKPITVSVTEIIQYGRKKVCHITTTTGNWKAALETHGIMEEYAKEIGCDSVMLWGRPGWAKTLPKFNFDSGRKYEQSYVVLEMKLGDNDNEIS